MRLSLNIYFNLIKMMNLINLLDRIEEWLSAPTSLFNNKIKCIECGEYYKPAAMKFNDSHSDSGTIINICGEACYSIYINKIEKNDFH